MTRIGLSFKKCLLWKPWHNSESHFRMCHLETPFLQNVWCYVFFSYDFYEFCTKNTSSITMCTVYVYMYTKKQLFCFLKVCQLSTMKAKKVPLCGWSLWLSLLRHQTRLFFVGKIIYGKKVKKDHHSIYVYIQWHCQSSSSSISLFYTKSYYSNFLLSILTC